MRVTNGGPHQQDPQAKLDWEVDWTAWLDGDTIGTSSWVAAAGITKSAETNTSTAARVWLEGGVNGTDYEITNSIITAGGRKNDLTFTLRIRQS
jgi:hypothetical protein